MLDRNTRQALEEIEILTALAKDAEKVLMSESLKPDEADKDFERTNYTAEELERRIAILEFRAFLQDIKDSNPIDDKTAANNKEMRIVRDAHDLASQKYHNLVGCLKELNRRKSSVPPEGVDDAFVHGWLDAADSKLDVETRKILDEKNAVRKKEEKDAAVKQSISDDDKRIQTIQTALVKLLLQAKAVMSNPEMPADITQGELRKILHLGNDFYGYVYQDKKLINEASTTNLASFQQEIQKNINSFQAGRMETLKTALSNAVDELKAAVAAYDFAVDAINQNNGTDFSARSKKINNREVALQNLIAASTKITSNIEDTLKTLDESAQKEIEKELEAYTTISSELTARIQQEKNQVTDSQALLEVEESIAELLKDFSTELAQKKPLTDHKTNVDELNARLNLLNEKLTELSQAARNRPDSIFQTSFNKALSAIISNSDSLSSKLDLLRKQIALVELCNNAVSQFADANINSKSKAEELTALDASWNAEFKKIDDLTQYIISNYCPKNTKPEDFFKTDKSINPDTYAAMESFRVEYTKARASLADKVRQLVDKDKLKKYINAIEAAKTELVKIDKDTVLANFEAQRKKFSVIHERLQTLKKDQGSEYDIAARSTLAEYAKVANDLENKLDKFEGETYNGELDKANIELDRINPADLKTTVGILSAINAVTDLHTKLTKQYEKLSRNTKESTSDAHNATIKRIALLTSELEEANRNVSAAKTPGAKPATPAEPAVAKMDPAVAASKERMERARVLWYQVYFVQQNAAENVSAIYDAERTKREEAFRAADKEYKAQIRISKGDKTLDLKALSAETDTANAAAETEKANRRKHVVQEAIAVDNAPNGKITAKDQYDIFRKQLDAKYLNNIILNLQKLEEKAAVLAYSAYNSDSIAKVELEAKQIEEDLQDLYALLLNIQNFRKRKEANKKDKTINNYDSPPRWPSKKQIEATLKQLEVLGIAKKELAAGAIDPHAKQHTSIFDKIYNHVETAQSNYLNSVPQQYMQYQYRDHKHLASDNSQNLYDFKNKPGDRDRLSNDIQKWIGAAPTTKTSDIQSNFSLGEEIDATGEFTVLLSRMQETVNPSWLDRENDQFKFVAYAEKAKNNDYYKLTLQAVDLKQLLRIPKVKRWAMIHNFFMVAAASGAGRDKHGNLDLRIPHMPKDLYEYELDLKGVAVAYGLIPLESFLTESERKAVEKRAKQIISAAAKNPDKLPMTLGKAAEVESATNVLASSTSILPGRLRR